MVGSRRARELPADPRFVVMAPYRPTVAMAARPIHADMAMLAVIGDGAASIVVTGSVHVRMIHAIGMHGIVTLHGIRNRHVGSTAVIRVGSYLSYGRARHRECQNDAKSQNFHDRSCPEADVGITSGLRGCCGVLTPLTVQAGWGAENESRHESGACDQFADARPHFADLGPLSGTNRAKALLQLQMALGEISDSQPMEREFTGARAFASRSNLQAIGKNLEHLYPVDEGPCFSKLLGDLDAAERRRHLRVK